MLSNDSFVLRAGWPASMKPEGAVSGLVPNPSILEHIYTTRPTAAELPAITGTPTTAILLNVLNSVLFLTLEIISHF